MYRPRTCFRRNENDIFIGLFLPAFVSVAIRQKRGTGCKIELYALLMEYGLTVLFSNLFTMAIITYVLRIDGVNVTAFNSFPFLLRMLYYPLSFAFCFHMWRKYGKNMLILSLLLKIPLREAIDSINPNNRHHYSQRHAALCKNPSRDSFLPFYLKYHWSSFDQ